jgi:hypothetical protein
VTQGNYIGSNSARVFSGPVHSVEFGAIDGRNLFDRVVVDINDGDGPERFDNLQYNFALVPEAEIYAMMAVGMGIMGWAARRKNRKQAAVV